MLVETSVADPGGGHTPPKIVKFKLNHTPSGNENIKLASLNNQLNVFGSSWDSSALD